MSDKVNNVTTRFVADVSQFLKDTQSMNRGIKQINAEFKNATAGMDRWQDSTEGIQAKLTQLNKTLVIEKARLEALEASYKELTDAGKENTAEAQKLATQILNQSAVVKRTERDINKYNATLNTTDEAVDDFVEAENEAATAADRLRKTIERQERELADLKEEHLNVVLEQGKNSRSAKQLSQQIERLSKELEDNESLLHEVDDATRDAGEGFTVAKGAIATFIGNGLSKLAGAAKDAVSKMLDLADSTREYRQTLATLDSAAGDVGVSTEFIRDKFTDMMGVFKDEDSVTEGLNNLLTAGFDESNLDDITKSLEGASLKWKDTLKFEGLADSMQEWIGSGGENLTGNFAELLERMGYNLDDVKKKTKGMTDEQRRQYAVNLLASEGLGEISEKYREQNKDMVAAQKANADYQNAVANLGATVEPITTKIREGFTRIVEKLLELVNDIDLEALGDKIDEAFNTFINDILPVILNGLQWILDNKDWIIAGIVGIGAAFLAWKVVGIIQSVISVIKGLTTAQALLNAVMAANPIGLVVAAIAALVAVFVVLWKKSDKFREFWINLWEKIKTAAKTAWEKIKGFFVGAWNSIKEIWNKAGAFFSGIWKSISNAFANVGTWFRNVFTKAWEGIKNVFSKVGSFFGGIWDTIKEKFTSIGTKIGDAIGGAFKKAANAVISTVESAINAIPNAINKMIGKINQLPNVNISPISTVSLPRLAKGGVVDRATVAQIGEAGREAIIPLERNTQGLKQIAEMLASNMGGKGGGVTVVNNNTFTGMTTTRYALHRANIQAEASWRMLINSQGGV